MLRSARHPLRHFTGYPAAIAITVIFYAVGLYASAFNSQTFDEGAHLVGGYIHWTLGHPRIHTENGYLSQAIAALPLLLTHPHAPSTQGYAFREAQPFTLGREFLFASNNDFGRILLLGRGAVGLLTAITALAVYGWTRKLYSALAGMMSLFIFWLAPLVLSHGFLATSDMAATCFFTLSLAAFSWTLQRVTPTRFAITALMLAALFLSKMSAPLILPALVLLMLLDCLDKPKVGTTCISSNNDARTPLKHFLRNGALSLALAIAVFGLIWAAYAFTYSAFKNSPPEANQTLYPPGQWTWALDKPTLPLKLIGFARDHRLLPESYLYGFAYVVQTGRVVVSFANGMATRSGWWWFYPFVFLITTPLPVLVLLLLRCIAPWMERRPVSKWGQAHPARRLRLKIRQAAPLWLFIVTYALAAIGSYRGSGPRHLLPMYPAICILLGALVRHAQSQRWVGYGILVLMVWLGTENVLVFPHYLSYFNEAVGGPSKGYRHLVDSAVDWGQDLPALATFLSKAGVPPSETYLSYFGSAEPAAYGVHATTLPGFLPSPEDAAAEDVPPLTPGLYCISVTMLENLYNGNFDGPYTPAMEEDYQAMRTYLPLRGKLLQDPATTAVNRDLLLHLPERLRTLRLARLCAFLRRREPFAQAGYSINMYAVTSADLEAALNGPPIYDGP